MATLSLCSALVMPAFADIGATAKLPPLDRDPNRCERGYTGNTIGQANGVSDKVLDIRMCNFDNSDLQGKVLSGALMSDSSFMNANMREAVLSKSYASNSKFNGADFTNAVIDRAVFTKADFTNAVFYNAVVTGVDFTDAIMTGANFEDALVGGEDVKRLCANPPWSTTPATKSDAGTDPENRT
eukprot:CAMPEP_0196582058 /NCGR_PEP_ID=MMETSP1081-20130531/37256_1 /TAXON_ID=36882 /ORGANISM="Pyramimonas amylifera, Strain CCMP720" /LENGTH=183 /DNA_ID=CAMNT_0041902521 /DNA_START=213 /DNA_END=765 /DNA_ORIENTATION=-